MEFDFQLSFFSSSSIHSFNCPNLASKPSCLATEVLYEVQSQFLAGTRTNIGRPQQTTTITIAVRCHKRMPRPLTVMQVEAPTSTPKDMDSKPCATKAHRAHRRPLITAARQLAIALVPPTSCRLMAPLFFIPLLVTCQHFKLRLYYNYCNNLT